ncbi:MAG: hypothetical protein JO072_06570, partial [Parafilimonas sp.]|nr:hypothetical protein [Parafilimonas sp.]
MKILCLSLMFFFSITALRAQNDYGNNGETKGFKKENVFLGGSISLGFGSGSFAIGANPEIGYSLAQWIDAGLAFNLNYSSQT